MWHSEYPRVREQFLSTEKIVPRSMGLAALFLEVVLYRQVILSLINRFSSPGGHKESSVLQEH